MVRTVQQARETGRRSRCECVCRHHNVAGLRRPIVRHPGLAGVND
jgi:hypothetical protein